MCGLQARSKDDGKMFWVVQNDLYEERGYHALMDTLKERRIPHTLVRIVPIVHRLLPHDFDTPGILRHGTRLHQFCRLLCC
jgi:hypothetical protein